MVVAAHKSFNHINTQWTPERDNQIREFAAKGISFTEMARKLSTTTSAVSNRARRIGVKGSRNKATASSLGEGNAASLSMAGRSSTDSSH